MSINYETAGVSIDEGNKAVDGIKADIKRTHTPGVLNSLGLFAGCFELPTGYQNPVLVSCTDGVGTKLKLAIDTGILDTVGVDLVAMCVNDLICCGAKPLFFLDYYACHKLESDHVQDVIKGMADACASIGCAIVGGEMAEMNDMYKPNDFDLGGFSVGIVEKSDMIDGQRIQANHHIYAIPSSGLHSNGFSLVRKVLTDEALQKTGISKESLLNPTRLYVNEVLELISKFDITGLAHITGGGLLENIERVLPKGIGIKIDRSNVSVPKIFQQIQDIGNIDSKEMDRVFNMGIGMVIISPDEIPESDDLYKIGHTINV